jgi:beta-lactamase regulating signal transducer with metallopeptidase domain
MAEALVDHLWQSTLCVLAAALLTLVFRKDRASVRFRIWFAASAKFLIPFASLAWIGGQLGSIVPAMPHVSPSLAAVMERISSPAAMLAFNFAVTPLAKASSHAHWNGWTILGLIWLLGFVYLLHRRALQWLRLQAIARASTPLDIDAPIPVRETTSNLEPGVFGIVSPIVLMPAGITSLLESAQLNSILDHELCHWRRRDNLAAAIHLLVETVFWFHPFVWWLGTRLLLERERACDEAVIQSGNNRHTYAEGILKVCQRYADTSLWSAGVSGGPLRKRIEEIMQNPVLNRLSVAKKSLLAMAAGLAIVAPVAAGLWGGPGIARADNANSNNANSIRVVHYINNEWKFELDFPVHWMLLTADSATNLLPRQVMTFGTSDSADRLLILSRHRYDPNKETLKTILESAQQDMAKNGFLDFVPGEPMTIGSKRAVRLDFERAPLGAEGVWYCRNYYIVGTHGAYILAFGARNITAAQREVVFKTYERMAKSFVFDDL